MMVAFCALLLGSVQAFAQCPEQSTITQTNQPSYCQQAPSNGNLVPYFTQCRTICYDNTGVGASNQVADPSCMGGTPPNNDLYFYAQNPYAQINNYDGSLVFRWVDWPNKASGVLPPYFAVHGEVRATFLGSTVQSIDCQDGFALENAICVDPTEAEGNQFYTPPATIPTLAQLTPIVRQIAGVNVDVTDVAFWIQIATSDGAQGPICVEVSSYEPGFLCGDAEDIVLTGSGNTMTGSAPAKCLCESALYGGIGNVNNGFTPACGSESSSSAWYKVTVPYGCNAITASLGNWGGTDDYNISILSGVDCPGSSGTNPITGAATFLPGQTMQPGAAVVASGCGSAASTACAPVPAGEYYIVVSGKTERPTFELNVSVENVAPTIGVAASPQNNTSVCSAGTVDVSTSGTVLPLSATCGQDIAWFYSTNLSFNPYNGQGTYLASGTNTSLSLPANTTCNPRTYYVKGIISDDGSSPSAGCKGTTNALSYTVYPEIGNVTVSRTQCLITVATRCGNFTVNGNAGVDNFIASFADDGTVQDFLISNGLSACNVIVSDTVSCSGNCTQPVASANSVCDPNDPFNFYVEVSFAPGSAATYFITDSDGGATAVSSAGTYTVGPYRNGSNVFISVENTDDTNCNIPVGTFSNDCNNIVCPNLTSATTTVSGNVCEDDQTILQAFVDQGTINVDYTVQWFRNGVAIPGANSLSVIHTFEADQGCSPEAQEFSVEIKCLLVGGSPSTQSSMMAGTVVVYPTPELGIDFIQDPDNCEVAPIDLCGNLDITYTPQNNPTPGAAPLTVSYTVKVPGAPAGCEATGTYLVNCPSCTFSAGAGVQPADDTYCYGEQFDVSTSNASLGTGYALSWAVATTDPYNDLNAAVDGAIQANNYFGPDSNGTVSYTFTNGTDYGPGQHYFIPFVSMLSIDTAQANFRESGTFNAPFLGATVTKVITIPDLPYCDGLTRFDINLRANRASGVGSPIDGVSGLVSYTGGGTSSVNLNRNNYTGNPSGQTITITASSTFGADINYTVTVKYQAPVTYPTICPTCNDVGTPIAVDLLPNINLAAINPPTICDGESIDLTALNPSANVAGTYKWYNGDPATTGVLVARPDSVVPASGTTYYVEFAADADTTCTAVTNFTINTTAAPTLTPIPAQPSICFGTTVDLTALEAGITSASGSFVWYKGDPNNNGIRLPNVFAQNLAPIDGQDYYAVFTSLATGCSNSVSISYTVGPLPVLSGVQRQRFCNGGSFDLTSLDTSYTTAPGTFTWYFGDPDTGAVALTNAQASNITPDSGDVYFVVFDDQASGCAAKGNVGFDVFSDPVVTVPTQAPLCDGDVVDLTALQPSMTSDPGTFVWYNGDPNAGGVMLTLGQAQAQTPDGTETYFAEFTNAITQCTGSTSFSYIVNPKPEFNTISTPNACDGVPFDLATLEPSFITGFTGTFTYYLGDPDTGAAMLTAAQVASQTPDGSETYFVVFTDANGGCADTSSFGFVVNPVPVVNAISDPAPLCAGSGFDLTTLESSITTDAGTFEWYLGDPTTTGTLVTTPASIAPADGDEYYAVFTDAAFNCPATVSITMSVADTIGGITASYNCSLDQLQVSFAGATGGVGGFSVAGDSPNNAGDVLASGSTWTIYVTDTAGCRDTLTGGVPCIVCDAGDGVAITGSNVLCCGDTLRINNTGTTLDVNRVTAWGLTPIADGPITSESEAFAAAANFRGNVDGSLTLEHDCDLPAGYYYATPYISVKPNENTPIVYDTMAGCRPAAELCPTISGTGWVLDPMILTFPDGSTYNVNQELAFGLPIDQTLLDAVTGGTLPCLDLTSIYAGDPNGTWTVSITNTGTGALSFSVPDFLVVVDADSCSLITTDQTFQVPSVSGTIAPGGSSDIDIVLPPALVTAPPVTYDTMAGCRPVAEICPTISGTGWVLDPMILTFPDGSTYNVNQELAFGLPIDQSLLDAVTGGTLPCLDLTSIYAGDPNGTWSVSITNTGTGSLSFSVPAFNIVVDADSCSLITTDEINEIDAVSGNIPPGGSNVVDIVIPAPPVTFPEIDPGCEDYGDAVEVVLLDPITYGTADIVCVDSVNGEYEVTIANLAGGAPDVLTGASYTFSEVAVFDAANNAYVISLSGVSFPYDVTVSNDAASVGGTECGTVITFDNPCTVGVEVKDLVSFLNIFPNPSKGVFNIDASLKESADVEISVMNVLGQQVYTATEHANAGKYNTAIDLTDKAEGVYMVTIITGRQMIVKRIMKD